MKKDKNSILSLKCCTVAVPDFNQSQELFVQSCYLQLVLMLLYDSLNLIVCGVNLWAVMLKDKIVTRKRKLRVLHCVSWIVLNARC